MLEQLGISVDILAYALVGTIVFCVIIFILLIVTLVKQSKLRKKYEKFMSGNDAASLESLVTTKFAEIESMKEHISRIDEDIDQIDHFVVKTYKKMAILKYDAFREMGGSLSFVIAMLTEENNGFVMNTMHSTREGSYTYIKEIKNGTCDTILSEEETKALQEALSK